MMPASSDNSQFIPPAWLRNGHLQTIVPNKMRRHAAGAALARRSRLETITLPDGDRLNTRWSSHGESPTAVLVVLHGLTGCAEADNVLAVASKGYLAGFDVVRVDLRNSQGDHPSVGIGHAGRSEDLQAVVAHVARRYPGAPTAVIAFSLGGNIALKALGEYGEAPPPNLWAAATISVPIDLDDACRAIDRRGNWVYRNYFLRRLSRRYLARRRCHPELFPSIDVAQIRTIRAWDNAVVAPLSGFADAEDYYDRSSALRVIEQIRVPSLIIHAEDDPFIPFGPFRRREVHDNESVGLLAPPHGGHVGFYAADNGDQDPDRFWAENRALSFCAEQVGLSWPPARRLDDLPNHGL
jgi:predicted alpha/beta-fold hydrolase